MDVVVDRVAGLDISKADVKVCVRVPEDGPGRSRYHEQTRTFATMTGDLLRLRDWMAECRVELVAMEATGDYWKPVVRHEALRNRVGVKGPRGWSVAAGR